MTKNKKQLTEKQMKVLLKAKQIIQEGIEAIPCAMLVFTHSKKFSDELKESFSRHDVSYRMNEDYSLYITNLTKENINKVKRMTAGFRTMNVYDRKDRVRVQESSLSSYFSALGVTVTQKKEPKSLEITSTNPKKSARVMELYSQLLPVYTEMGALESKTDNGVTVFTIKLQGE